MPSRDRSEWKPDANGIYTRQIGYTRTASGKLSQPKFRLGAGIREAKRRSELIRALWDHLEEVTREKPVCWTTESLLAAKEISQGKTQVKMPRQPDEDAIAYAKRINGMQREMPMVPIAPADEVDYAIGVTVIKGTYENLKASARAIRSLTDEFMFAPYEESLKAGTYVGGPTLHDALRAHIDDIEKKYTSGETGEPTQWGRTRMRRAQSLIDHHCDVALAALDEDKVEGLFNYWRKRPNRKGTEKAITRKSAANQVAALKAFLKWLHRTKDYEWSKPEGFNDLETRVESRESDRRRQIGVNEIFSLDELTLLNKYATPLERIFLLLGLNCGFGRAEIASLLVGEIFLHTQHDEHLQELLAYKGSSADSFIKRVRRKSNVYAEHILFPQTVAGIVWALEYRKRFGKFGSEDRLLLSKNGQPYDKATKSANANQQITNRFDDLCRRVRSDKHELRSLSFGKVRKTAGDLIRRFSDGEISGVFLCHGQPVKSDSLADVYTSRPFGKVFQAIRRVEDYLKPVFEAAGPEPFVAPPQARTSRSSIEQIVKMHIAGASPSEIADKTGKAISTVQRHITRATGPRRPGRPRKQG